MKCAAVIKIYIVEKGSLFIILIYNLLRKLHLLLAINYIKCNINALHLLFDVQTIFPHVMQYLNKFI